MLQWVLTKLVGSKNERELRRLWPIVEKINQWELSYRKLSDKELAAKTDEFRARLQSGQSLDDLLPEAFAAVKNVCWRFTQNRKLIRVRGHDLVWDMVPFDVQLLGAIVLHMGKIAEMATGEGKTLVAVMPAYLNALTGRGVHIVTVNDYLAARDSEWMGEIYRFLGMSVGCLQQGQTPEERRQQYLCDVCYGTNSEFGFDYLRDNSVAIRAEEQVQRGHYYAIVDEVDSILIDEARTPLIISGPATVASSEQYQRYKEPVARLVREQAIECARLAERAQKLLSEGGPREEIGRLLFKIKLAMPRNRQLLRMLEDGEVRRMMEDAELALYQDSRRIELFQLKEELLFAIDEKNNEADLTERGRRFLSPGDPDSFVPPDLVVAFHDIDSDTNLSPEQKEKRRKEVQRRYDEVTERIHAISQLLKAYCLFEKDVHYVVQDNKVIIVDEFTGRLMPGRRWSDGLHQAVEAKEGVQIDRETQTLATVTIQNYFRLYEKLAGMTGTAATEANEFHDIYKLDVVTIPTNKPVRRTDLDDSIFKTRRAKYNAIVQKIKELYSRGQPVLVGTISVEASELLSRMLKREGIPHSVLNAKYHQQEAEIIARAGQRGAVTIATNMAGRGTDIKLGPGVAELGGLFVLGTERHEARRIDYQLRGRCARQGDPGVSKFFISLEDDLMRNFGDSRKIASLLTRLGMKEDEELEHPWLTKAVETAQKRVEQRNYMIRKHTLQYDDVLNLQRQVVYSYRNEVLHSDNPREEIFEVVEEVVREEATKRLESEEPDVEGFLSWVNLHFPLAVKPGDFPWAENADRSAEECLRRIREAYELKIKFEDPGEVKEMERYIVLSAIDRLWQEHLYAMDGLRGGIGLRAYGQRDPLVEYKQEAFAMFQELMGQLKREIVHNLFRSASSLLAFEQFLAALPQKLVKEDVRQLGLETPVLEAPGQLHEPQGDGEEIPEVVLPIRRAGPKMGRNDPCPLDPTKKFKHCCGALGEKTCIKVVLGPEYAPPKKGAKGKRGQEKG
ncbi:preprotein translocase subunit SecA [Candidatus Methylacidithermus pantelleriae]|uniref:Protein translocase subunit SecA n=1 Tax=Candidatus Methylacidithermus pantelleriae TaxID=2744239 RepID=A0A8J2BR28_9BACT|nr:preprotein translocase subunit SecA [Candidatus Methylacidithermus pantelleriae]CAF0703675.1 Protein translocase subunit SecA [Candidatus Methylacidithermus pantelleriae]